MNVTHKSQSPATMPAGVKDDFPILTKKTNEPPLAYLDNAATTQRPREVIDAIVSFYENSNANVGRSVHSLSMIAGDIYEDSRRQVADFINAPESENVVFTRSATESLNFVAMGFGNAHLSPRDEVLVTELEHHSNILPWKELCARTGAVLRVVPVDQTGAINIETVGSLIGPRTKIIAVAHVSNMLGALSPVKEIVKLGHTVGARVVVDGAQAVAHLKVDVQELGADFYCFSAHKMYGPMGIGVLYGTRQCLNEMTPPLVGGGIARDVGFDGRPTQYLQVPHRLEAGTPNIAGAAGLAAAVCYMRDIGLDVIERHDNALVRLTMDGLRDIPGIILYSPHGGPKGVVSFNIEGIHPYDIGNHLNSCGVAVRTGVHCAVPMADRLGAVGTVRASFGVYNTDEDVNRLIEGVRGVRPGTWSKQHPVDRFLKVAH
ncbi:cysteine desulfurase [Gluconacetobacter entanii]|uniref:aminotransferase class V-fold PLP-dependent enzyme n=1 Tax=Gluconacetobacter entanii TaxID=108528 RepID=UPI001C935F18|nr:cysteine desulfurase [Gluconacetobacter entanii]MBY4640948.1 cysteine desulfurase [Gluconacetobacter entanii]MCW4579041.1 cysteine desulfurase [Gluconacetobacter entanii]MCW4582441.1 cysteine desulfurase [Gluconacetobacter entanii]MCW4585828.1 cysteine desulfurase [Gluconacetobacter entanii]